MRKINFLIMAALILSLITSTATAAVQPGLSGDAVTDTAGKTVDFRVSLSGNPGIIAFRIKLEYDPTVLEPVTNEQNPNELTCRRGDFTDLGNLMGSVKKKSCQILWYAPQDVCGNGTAFIMQFHILDTAATGTYPVRVSYVPEDTVNAAGQSVSFACTDGSVTVRDFVPTIAGQVLTAKQGDECDYSVFIRDNPGIAGYRIMLDYDPSAVAPVTETDPSGREIPYFRTGSEFASGTTVCTDNGTTLSVLWSSPNNTVGEGVAFTVKFKISDSAHAGLSTIRLRYITEDTLDENEKPVVFTSIDGAVKIQYRSVIQLVSRDNHNIVASVQNAAGLTAVLIVYEDSGKMVLSKLERIGTDIHQISLSLSEHDLSYFRCVLLLVDQSYVPVRPITEL